MKPMVFAPSARAEFEAAAEWYESHADGLGEKFAHCIDEIVGRIEESPVGFPIWDGDRKGQTAPGPARVQRRRNLGPGIPRAAVVARGTYLYTSPLGPMA
jgi:hypothetical protein